MPNRLAHETSPYLRQHAENPVDWYPWSEEAFARARAEDRPVLLSVGYSACHWCHVMAHESFEDPAIAQLMNELFVNIKVDREERPDVDTIYMQAVQGMTGRGGWPMTVFLTPDAVPFFGGTYFPPRESRGMPAFPRVLRAAADAYHTRRDEITSAAERMRDALTPTALPPAREPAAEQLDTAARALVEQTDAVNGGFGDAPKFPHPMAVDLMLRRHRVTQDSALLDAAVLTLDRMQRGGIHDQVGGGFHRYSVDGRWAVPHFEKMLYDNAQLVPAYLHAHQVTGRADFRATCERTLEYMQRELLLESGGFAASQDADSPGGEGAYFVWSPATLADVLGPDDARFAMRVFGVTDEGNFEHGTTVLSQPQPLGELARDMSMSAHDMQLRVASLRERLFTARRERAAPARDDKVVTAWNALTVKAFAEAGAVLGREDLQRVARQTAQFLLEALLVDGVVHRTWKDGRAHIRGFLDDVAHLADALLTVYEISGEPRFFAAARDLADTIVQRFRGADGSYYDTAGDAEPLIVRPRTLDDNPVTSGQAAAASVFARLNLFTGDEVWRERALEIVAPLAPALTRAPLALSGLAGAIELVVGPAREIAVSGDAEDARTRALVGAVLRRFDPARVLAWGPADGVPLLDGRPTVSGAPAAYVCEHFACAAPVTDPSALERVLSGRP